METKHKDDFEPFWQDEKISTARQTANSRARVVNAGSLSGAKQRMILCASGSELLFLYE